MKISIGSTLVLTRKVGQRIMIGDDGSGNPIAIVSVSEIKGSSVRLCIEAPKQVPVFREEIYIERKKGGQ